LLTLIWAAIDLGFTVPRKARIEIAAALSRITSLAGKPRD